jgi:small acid-soluble spore protein I
MKIQDYIINNFKEDDINTLRNTITECIQDDDEETLPGMGVFLNLIWSGSDEELRKQMLNTLHQELKK